jgi:RNA polymerase sigma factor (sigma-70 family)
MSQRKINGILKHNVSSNFTVSCDQSAFEDGDLNSQLGYIENNKIDTNETTTDVFELLAKSDDREALYKAIDNLKSDYKELVKMRFFNGMGVSEIAKHYNQSPSNITVKIDNMLKALKNEFLKVA